MGELQAIEQEFLDNDHDFEVSQEEDSKGNV